MIRIPTIHKMITTLDTEKKSSIPQSDLDYIAQNTDRFIELMNKQHEEKKVSRGTKSRRKSQDGRGG